MLTGIRSILIESSTQLDNLIHLPLAFSGDQRVESILTQLINACSLTYALTRINYLLKIGEKRCLVCCVVMNRLNLEQHPCMYFGVRTLACQTVSIPDQYVKMLSITLITRNTDLNLGRIPFQYVGFYIPWAVV